MSLVDEVKQKTDIVAVISQYATVTKAGQNFRALCPFHSEKKPSFYIYPAQQSWHCFGACSTGGDAISFVMKKEGMPFGEALRLLADKAGVTLTVRSEQETKLRDKLLNANQAAANFFHRQLLESPEGRKAREYLEKRGVNSQSIDEFQLGYAPDKWEGLKEELVKIGYNETELSGAGLVLSGERGGTHDRFRHKLMFPIFDDRGRVTGFGARVLDDSLPKYINSPQTPVFDKGGSLYGIHLAREAIRKRDLAIMVEGYMDVIIAHQYGFRNVIAAMGIAIGDRQLGAIKKLTANLALALDADSAGEEAMLKGVGYENTLGSEVRIIVLPEGKDPDEVIKADASAWEKLVQTAPPVMDYTFKTMSAGLDLTTVKDKSLAADRLLPVVSVMTGTIRRGHYLVKLADMLGIRHDDMRAALSRFIPDRRAKESRPVSSQKALKTALSSPIDDGCLALLLQNPELKTRCDAILPEYFESTLNREVFVAYRECRDAPVAKQRVDESIHDHFDHLCGMSVRSSQIEQRFTDYCLRLRKKYLRRLELMKKEVLSLEAQSGGRGADLAKLEEQGIDTSIQLREVFAQEARGKPGAKRREA